MACQIIGWVVIIIGLISLISEVFKMNLIKDFNPKDNYIIELSLWTIMGLFWLLLSKIN